jgi:hypothetical protein
VDLDAPAAAPTPGSSVTNSSTGATDRCADILARLLPQWVPKGQDLYAIGVQECASLPRLREVLLSYLNGGNGDGGGNPDGPPASASSYAVFKTEIGDDTIMHGFIALTLFVRQGDVASGAFRLHRAGVGGVATGMGLGPMGRAANKVGR